MTEQEIKLTVTNTGTAVEQRSPSDEELQAELAIQKSKLEALAVLSMGPLESNRDSRIRFYGLKRVALWVFDLSLEKLPLAQKVSMVRVIMDTIGQIETKMNAQQHNNDARWRQAHTSDADRYINVADDLDRRSKIIDTVPALKPEPKVTQNAIDSEIYQSVWAVLTQMREQQRAGSPNDIQAHTESFLQRVVDPLRLQLWQEPGLLHAQPELEADARKAWQSLCVDAMAVFMSDQVPGGVNWTTAQNELIIPNHKKLAESISTAFGPDDPRTLRFGTEKIPTELPKVGDFSPYIQLQLLQQATKGKISEADWNRVQSGVFANQGWNNKPEVLLKPEQASFFFDAISDLYKDKMLAEFGHQLPIIPGDEKELQLYLYTITALVQDFLPTSVWHSLRARIAKIGETEKKLLSGLRLISWFVNSEVVAQVTEMPLSADIMILQPLFAEIEQKLDPDEVTAFKLVQQLWEADKANLTNRSTFLRAVIFYGSRAKLRAGGSVQT